MPVQVFEEPAPGSNEAASETQVVLQNDLIRAVFFPNQGTVSLFDRDEQFFCNLYWGVDGPAPATHLIHEAEDGSIAAVFLQSIDMHRGLAWTSCWTLGQDATISLEVKFQNRRHKSTNDRLQLVVEAETSQMAGMNTIQSGHTKSALNISWSNPLYQGQLQGNQLTATRPLVPLGGFRVEEVQAKLSLFTKISACQAGSKQVAGAVENGLVAFQAASALEGKVFLQTSSGQTLESPLSLTAGESIEQDVSALGEIHSWMIRSNEGQVILEYPSVPPKQIDPIILSRTAEFSDVLDSHLQPVGDIWPWTLVHGFESMAYRQLAILQIKNQEWGKAIELIDKALSYNAEDPLLWWLRAAVERHSGSQDPDSASLTNGHVLAPLEPILKVEAFLAQQNLTKDANPLLKNLSTREDAVIECALLLYQAGFLSDLSSFLDEMLRHQESARWRVWLAWIIYSDTRMKATAAEHLVKASKSGLDSEQLIPLEKVMIQKLAYAFPEISLLQNPKDH